MKINRSKTLLCDPTIGEFVKLLATAVTQQAQQIESIRSMLLDIHQQIYLLPTRREANAIKRTIIKTITTNRKSVEEMDGPQTATRREQVRKVFETMHNAHGKGITMTLNQACLEVWTPLNDGYPTPKALYEYCHAHENEY